MRRLGVPAAFIALLAAGGFAAVSIAQGGGLAHVTTAGTTGLTVTTPGKVTLCHRTGSKKHPFHTISVAPAAVRAHLAHGDVLGSCTAATVATMKRHGKGAAKHTTTTTTTTTTGNSTPTTAPSHGQSGEHGKSGEHGNSGNNGNNGGGHH